MAASILQQLMALYFAMIQIWQILSSKKSLVGKKIPLYISRILQTYISITQIFFFIFFDKCLFTIALIKNIREPSWMSHKVSFCSFL